MSRWSSNNETFIESLKKAVGYLAAKKEESEAKRRGRRAKGRQRMDEELSVVETSDW